MQHTMTAMYGPAEGIYCGSVHQPLTASMLDTEHLPPLGFEVYVDVAHGGQLHTWDSLLTGLEAR